MQNSTLTVAWRETPASVGVTTVWLRMPHSRYQTNKRQDMIKGIVHPHFKIAILLDLHVSFENAKDSGWQQWRHKQPQRVNCIHEVNCTELSLSPDCLQGKETKCEFVIWLSYPFKLQTTKHKLKSHTNRYDPSSLNCLQKTISRQTVNIFQQTSFLCNLCPHRVYSNKVYSCDI